MPLSRLLSVLFLIELFNEYITLTFFVLVHHHYSLTRIDASVTCELTRQDTLIPGYMHTNMQTHTHRHRYTSAHTAYTHAHKPLRIHTCTHAYSHHATHACIHPPTPTHRRTDRRTRTRTSTSTVLCSTCCVEAATPLVNRRGISARRELV